MSQFEQLMQALTQAQQGYDQSFVDLQPLEDRRQKYSTRSTRGIIPGLIETAWDANRRKKYEPQYQEALLEAMGSARGVDEAKQELMRFEAEMAARQAEAEANATYWRDRADKQYDAGTEHEREMEKQAAKDAAAMQRTKARGPNSTYNIPAPEKGYWYTDPANPGAGVKPIPGSAAERAILDQQSQAESKNESNRGKYQNLVSVADDALALLKPTTTGISGAVASKIPGTDRISLESSLDTLKANLGFDRLQQMRDESKTGGALGQVAVQELNMLQSVLASLNPDQNPDTLRANIEKVQSHYGNFLDALDGKRPKAGGGQADLERMAQEAIAQGADPEKVRQRIAELRNGRQ